MQKTISYFLQNFSIFKTFESIYILSVCACMCLYALMHFSPSVRKMKVPEYFSITKIEVQK